MGFYAQQARRARLLLGGRFGQDGITLVREITIPPENPWDDPVVTSQTVPLQAVQRGVEADLVGRQVSQGGPVIGSSAKHVTAVPCETWWPLRSPWSPTDRITINGISYLIMSAEPVGDPAAPVFVKFLVQA